MTWQDRLVAYIASLRRLEYAPGQHDCALFAAGAVAAMTGHDYAAPYRGRYASLPEGLALLQADGFDDHIALAAAHLHEVPPAYSQPGDLAVIETPEGPALGVVQGEFVYLVGEGAPIVLVSLRHAVRAFRVEHN